MRIAHVANHGRGLNDDEGAITHALRELGHEVECVREWDEPLIATAGARNDFLLCHHLPDPAVLAPGAIPKVFWHFDRIGLDKPAFLTRTARRREHVAALTDACDLGFMTDGDYVAADTTGKLRWLPQGADGRFAGRGTPREPCDILYVGNRRGREDFLAEMRGRWGGRFRWVPEGCYREQLRDVVAGAKVLVAPDWPVSDRYWSNRVYVMLGFGAFLLHPWCEGLAGQYKFGREIDYYRDRGQLHDLIRHYLQGPDTRRQISDAGLARTLAEHTYTNRCRELVRVVRDRLSL